MPHTRFYTEYEALAEQEGFIVVHPTGSEPAGVPVLEMGLGWELFDGLETSERDDLAFANALIDELVANWCADADRICGFMCAIASCAVHRFPRCR